MNTSIGTFEFAWVDPLNEGEMESTCSILEPGLQIDTAYREKL